MPRVRKKPNKDRQKALANLYAAVNECVRIFGYVRIEAGNEAATANPQIGIRYVLKG